MAWKTGYNTALGMGLSSLAVATAALADTSPVVAVGTIIKGYDDVFGEGEFIYLPGVAALAAGDVVAYDLLPGGATVTRALAAMANSGRPLAVALSPITGPTTYGWYQIGGVAIANAVVGTVAGNAVVSATTGSIQSTHIAGSQILGARTSAAVGTPAAGKSYVTLSRPHMQGAIT